MPIPLAYRKSWRLWPAPCRLPKCCWRYHIHSRSLVSYPALSFKSSMVLWAAGHATWSPAYMLSTELGRKEKESSSRTMLFRYIVPFDCSTQISSLLTRLLPTFALPSEFLHSLLRKFEPYICSKVIISKTCFGISSIKVQIYPCGAYTEDCTRLCCWIC